MKNLQRKITKRVVQLMLSIGLSTTGVMAQSQGTNDCEMAVAAMINLAQINMSNQETMLQLSGSFAGECGILRSHERF